MKKIIKKLTQLTLTAALVLGMSLAVIAATTETGASSTGAETTTVTKAEKCGKYSTWVYNEDTKTLTISGTGRINETTSWSSLDIKHVEIKYGITTIGKYAFSQLKSIESASIPNTVTKIGRYAFSRTGLKHITVGENVTSFGYSVFEKCRKLESVTWNAPKIPDYAFYNCKALKKVKIGDKVEKICSFAFHNTGLEEIVVPNNITQLENNAFSYCKNLNSLTLSKNIETLPSRFISGTKNLTEITLPKKLTKITNFAFSGTYIEKLKIPNSVTSMGKHSLNGAYRLKEVKLPNNIKSIKDEFFSDCRKLEKVKIGKKVTYIGELAFANCKKLKNITIPGNVKVIGYKAFEGAGLETVTIENGVKKLDFWAFYNCNKLKSITIPESVTIIQENALADCARLTNITVSEKNDAYSSVNGCLLNKSKTKLFTVPAGKSGTFEIPSTVKKIESIAFSGCTKITNIASSTNSNFTTVDGILYNGSKKTLIKCPSSKTGTITIPSTVTRIEESAFSESKASQITIPDSVKSIGYCAFEYCSNLKTIRIPSSVKTISNAAFWGCSKLRKVTIEKGVQQIGRNAFHDCENLRKVIIPTSVSKIGKTSFSSCYDVTFYCKKSSYAMSYAVNKWSIDYKLI